MTVRGTEPRRARTGLAVDAALFVHYLYFMRKGGYVYILGSLSRVLYVGVTADLARRLHEHRTSAVKGFTTRYNIWRLLWCEPHDDILGAIAREKQIKRWRREKKLALIAQSNPEFRDLWPLLNR